MGTVYILSDHGKLAKQNDALMFVSGGETRKIFLHRTDRIIIAGNIEITGSALRLIMRNQIDTIFLSANGKFNGKLEFEEERTYFYASASMSPSKNQISALKLPVALL